MPCEPSVSGLRSGTSRVKPWFLPRGCADAPYTRAGEDGGIEIDNNAAEGSLRGVVLGRKNYLFAGSDAGGERAAAMYSLSGSAKLNGLDPPKPYPRQGLSAFADDPVNGIEESMPRSLKAEAAAPDPS